MPLGYVTLFLELLEITKKITLNTIEDEQKQSLAKITDSVIKDITYILRYCSEQEYSMDEAKKLMILTKLGNHQKRLNVLIEQLAITKTCSKCGKTYKATPRNFYRDHRAKYGLRNDCIQCHRESKKELYHKHKNHKKNKLQSGKIDKEEDSRKEYETIIQK